jgi:hypothetical protein
MTMSDEAPKLAEESASSPASDPYEAKSMSGPDSALS